MALHVAVQLWEDLGNWHSSLRKKAHMYVTQHYKWDPNNHWEVNFAIVKDLLGDCGGFLRDGVDKQVSHICARCPCLIHSQGHTNDLVHPALSGLIIDFFYSGASSVGQLFPEIFAAEVPRVMVAISATAVFLVLLYILLRTCAN